MRRSPSSSELRCRELARAIIFQRLRSLANYTRASAIREIRSETRYTAPRQPLRTRVTARVRASGYAIARKVRRMNGRTVVHANAHRGLNNPPVIAIIRYHRERRFNYATVASVFLQPFALFREPPERRFVLERTFKRSGYPRRVALPEREREREGRTKTRARQRRLWNGNAQRGITT